MPDRRTLHANLPAAAVFDWDGTIVDTMTLIYRANVAALCGREPALRDACRDEVQLLRRLPACDAACQAEADAAWPRATR